MQAADTTLCPACDAIVERHGSLADLILDTLRSDPAVQQATEGRVSGPPIQWHCPACGNQWSEVWPAP